MSYFGADVVLDPAEIQFWLDEYVMISERMCRYM